MISSFGRGGAPALIVNYMTHLTDENIKFDFLEQRRMRLRVK